MIYLAVLIWYLLTAVAVAALISQADSDPWVSLMSGLMWPIILPIGTLVGLAHWIRS